MAESKVSLKLLIDTKTQRVLFAEADKTTVDFLFDILSLPVGTVVRLLSKQGMAGCLENLYKSVENLNETYIQPNQTKDTLLKPRSAFGVCSSSISLLSITDNEPSQKLFYKCHNAYCYYVAEDPRATCPGCGSTMSTNMTYVNPPPAVTEQNGRNDADGFVKGVVTYMVMDDLEVKPMSTISSIALLNKFCIKEVRSLEEKVVDLGMDEALMLLKTSLESKTVLTNIFLKKRENNLDAAWPLINSCRTFVIE
ncbi:hypothetical protein ACH5RR_019182 [Cinchona calisaya]|uniref:DUF674 domain-containing protein n=1 Tax=Cinchona calisaya TaxID=153742 RepID=A0ABD2ZPX6_9GENT